MIDFIALVVMIASVGFIVFQFHYIKKKNKEIQRYPYFHLRDIIIHSIYSSKDPKKYNSIYELVNFSINNLKLFKYNNYSKAIDRYLNAFFEELVANDFVIINRHQEYDRLLPEEKKFGELLIQTARKNSFLLRLAMSELGFNIMFTYKIAPRLFKSLVKYISSDKFRPQYETARKVSYLNRIMVT